ncbi:hypothetical protein [Anthocerotibacter panamensis]|nr:hypothetical protein [Anthocerotibacter panamensis]
MSDHTRQLRWSVTIKENLEILFAQDPYVFVAVVGLSQALLHQLQ